MHCPRSLTAAAWPAMCRLAWSLALLPSLQAQHGWVAETSNFRVVASERSGLDDVAVASAAEDLESVRQRCLLDGLGTPRRLDGRLEVLLVGTMLELHSLLRDPPDSRTRGITIRGLDQAFVVVPWRALPGPRVTLAHEYSHQLDDPAWPLWFKEGRAVYLGRRMLPRSGTDPLLGLLAMLDRSEWLDWSKLLEADRESAMAKAKTFQAQSWLLVHWLVSSGRSIARLLPDDVGAVLDHHGPAGLTDALRGYLASLWDFPPAPAEPVPALAPITVRPAVNWEVPLFEAEILRALRFLDAAEPQLADLAERFRGEGRVQAAYASLLLLRNRQDEAEQRYRAALNLGDPRSRSAYRYALLLMRPGPAPRHESGPCRGLRIARPAQACPRNPPTIWQSRRPACWSAIGTGPTTPCEVSLDSPAGLGRRSERRTRSSGGDPRRCARCLRPKSPSRCRPLACRSTLFQGRPPGSSGRPSASPSSLPVAGRRTALGWRTARSLGWIARESTRRSSCTRPTADWSCGRTRTSLRA